MLCVLCEQVCLMCCFGMCAGFTSVEAYKSEGTLNREASRIEKAKYNLKKQQQS